MCASCGCGMVNEDHGDRKHITYKDLEDAAKAANISVDDVADNIQDAVAMSAAEVGEEEEVPAG